ncbi:sensor histidine kinase [Halobacillus yeomjeoni]|uniref:histidine kinase n=1 Tax=Halobacillus yeomjeoni TaxID=311194 RepID=A0A931MVD7_9BACI|nr:HAMP domain-containing sensor histidine kinase [Halobacillus yeomjeoni]MBH0230475.1 HAMP domain-containing histidine kinase [Halobacillus yeomjeoni]
MKLLYQLNTAFTALIVVLMSFTAFFIYSLLMDMLIQDEQRQLKARSELLVNLINDPGEKRETQLAQLLQDRNYPILLFNKSNDQIVFRTLSRETSFSWMENYEEKWIEEEVWEGQSGKYVVYDFPINSNGDQIMVMATPLNDLQSVQTEFALRMLLIFFLGLVVAIIISYFLTRRLVTPLSRLKQEVQKIERRQFHSVQPVQASGEIKEVEQSVREMAAELSRYIHSQKQFFQNASHELKTPLMSIQGYAEGIRDGVFEGQSAEKGLNVIVSETERLKKIVNEMILLAKLDSSEDVYHPERTDLINLLQQSKDRMIPLAKERQVDLKTDFDSSFYSIVDPERVLQALINIISNAIRHAESEVSIHTDVGSEEIIIKVTDDGEGISEDLLPQLFQRFIKGKEGETGLGLAISRAIIERSGGKIQASNLKEGKGAVFEIRLPRKD